METRTILIANNKTQRRYSIETNATTLGELQDQMTAQGIDFSGMTFTEGITKTQLLDRESLLPTNVMFKGSPTNNLVMLLTNPNKRVASGAYPTVRKEFGAFIKEHNLGDLIKEEFGNNWTRVSTANLISFFEDLDSNADASLEEVREELDNLDSPEVAPKESKLPDVKTAPHANTVNWFYDGVKAMVSDKSLHADDIVVLANLTTELALRLKESEPKITDADIDDMLVNLL